jgi:NhaA family Na+:H+ antiporter
MFGLANAGVAFSAFELPPGSYVSLLVGKSVASSPQFAEMLGFPLPNGMQKKTSFGWGACGVRVYRRPLRCRRPYDPIIQGAAKMGAMLSFSAAIIAVPLGKILRIRKVP